MKALPKREQHWASVLRPTPAACIDNNRRPVPNKVPRGEAPTHATAFYMSHNVVFEHYARRHGRFPKPNRKLGSVSEPFEARNSASGAPFTAARHRALKRSHRRLHALLEQELAGPTRQAFRTGSSRAGQQYDAHPVKRESPCH